jgi:pentatricopeptide repeat protein
MRGAGVARNARAFEHGMTAAMVLERFDLALAIWAEMRAPAAGGTARAGGMQGMGATEAADMGPPVGAPLRPTARAFNAAMSALERSGRSAEALALYKQMEAEGVAPGERQPKKPPTRK